MNKKEKIKLYKQTIQPMGIYQIKNMKNGKLNPSFLLSSAFRPSYPNDLNDPNHPNHFWVKQDSYAQISRYYNQKIEEFHLDFIGMFTEKVLTFSECGLK